jgi:hypothetical protein
MSGRIGDQRPDHQECRLIFRCGRCARGGGGCVGGKGRAGVAWKPADPDVGSTAGWRGPASRPAPLANLSAPSARTLPCHQTLMHHCEELGELASSMGGRQGEALSDVAAARGAAYAAGRWAGSSGRTRDHSAQGSLCRPIGHKSVG